MATAKKPAKTAKSSKTATEKTSTTPVEPPASAKEVTFEVEAPKASKVLVAGSFNGWKAETALKKNKNGKWSATVELPPGTHQYRYMIDGSWFTQPSAPTVANPYGSANNVVVVK